MKKIISLILVLGFLLILPIFKPNPDFNAYSIDGCPVGVSIGHPYWSVINSSNNIYIYDAGFPRFSRALISFGDGTVDTVNFSNSSPVVGTNHSYSQVGDFPIYALIDESNDGWDYVCYSSKLLPVYYVYQSFSANISDPGVNNATFDANTLPGGDNIIGAVNVSYCANNGTGGASVSVVNNSYGVRDTADFEVKNQSTRWFIVSDAGDTDITNSSTNFGSFCEDLYVAVPNLSDRTNELTGIRTRADNAYINYGSPSQQVNNNTSVNASFTFTDIYWRPRVVGQPPTPTIPGGGGGTPTPTPTEMPSNYWSFPAQVLNSSLTPVPGVNLKLSYSDDIPNNSPQPQGDMGIFCTSQLIGGTYWNYFSHSSCSPPNLTNCSQDVGYCYLATPNLNASYNHNYYYVRIADPNYSVIESYCRWGDNSFGSSFTVPPYTARPSTASSCTAVTLDSGEKAILRGNTPFGFSAAARGSYSGNVLIVATTTPTPTVSTPTPTPTNTPTPAPQSKWFQTLGGNAYSAGDITSFVPSGEKFNKEITDTASEGISYSRSLSVGTGTPGKNSNSTAFPEFLSYTELYNRFNNFNPDITGSSLAMNSISPAGSMGNTQAFEVPGSTTLAGSWTGFSGNAVVFIDGNLNIDTNVTVNSGSFLGFVVNGNIVIDDTVTQVDGFYFSVGTISTGTNGPSAPDDTQLVLNGTFVADSFNLQRDLGSSNSTTPAEAFNYRPDFSFTAPLELRRPYRYFQEVAP